MSIFKKVNIFLAVVCFMMAFTGCNTNVTAPVSIPDNVKKEAVINLTAGDNIQDAVNKASDGCEIILAEGKYMIDKPVDIANKKNITMTGKGVVWVESERTDHQIFYISYSDNILFKNIKAQHLLTGKKGGNSKPLTDNRKGSVIDVEGCRKISFEDCEFVGCGIYGIYASNTNEVNVIQCYLHHNSLKALGFVNTKGYTNVLLKDCKIVNNTDFIKKEGDIRVTMAGNNIIENNNPTAYKQR